MTTTFTIAPSNGDAPCRANADLFDFVGFDQRRASTDSYREAADACRSLCESCPMFSQCLTRAVTGPDMEGFVAGTTATDRARLKQLLNIEPETLNVDRLAGCGSPSRAAVPRWRIENAVRRHPSWTVQQIADEVGCSWHTVDRYMRTRAHRPAVDPMKVTRQEVTDLYVATVA